MMSKKNETKLTRVLIIMIPIIMVVIFMLFNTAFADAGTEVTSTVITKAILPLVKRVAQVVGIILVLVGLVKFIIAYSEESGPDQRKAAMMIATGAILIGVGTLLETIASTLVDLLS